MLSDRRLVSSAYLRLLVFLLVVLIPACASSTPAFQMTCSAYKLNKYSDTIQTFHTPFLTWKQSVCCSMSGPNCCFLFCIQISQEAGKVFWCSPLFKNILQFIVIHIFKGFSIVSEAEVDFFFFLEFSCCNCDTVDADNLILFPLPFLNSA